MIKRVSVILLILLSCSFSLNKYFSEVDTAISEFVTMYTDHMNEIVDMQSPDFIARRLDVVAKDMMKKYDNLFTVIENNPEILRFSCFSGSIMENLVSALLARKDELERAKNHLNSFMEYQAVATARKKMYNANVYFGYRLAKMIQEAKYASEQIIGDNPVYCTRGTCTDGSGIAVYPKTCTIHKGAFKKRIPQGTGTLFYNDGRVEKGTWDNGVLKIREKSLPLREKKKG